ncbi:MAG: carboxypeptidase regulatory-like domain-containing protein [Candidatus Marinimicrobia bacterium]|nr:carboxypeptidase regulatory-like domain-containing protein [Candidatus Neomarinimicrobiota bacterium]MBL7023180.1 carboxypeptidase regulatory-like domain-containing protein [Candidatus Neomarinimicrobiota bacterium]MBL7109235.1 carboxypeptidase regulatory-like domain-containing protein [Candidatus Neomarinimicrobiota bacterium]
MSIFNRVSIIIFLGMIVAFSFAEERMVIRFNQPDKFIIEEFNHDNYDVAGYKPNEYWDIVVSQSEYDRITELGYTVDIVQTENQLKNNLKMRTDRDLAGYRNYEDVINELQQIEAEYPGLCKLYDVGESWGKEYSDNGNSYYDNYHHEIWALKVSDNVETEEDEPSVYFMGEHHAREPISLEVVMSNLYYILDNYGLDQTITDNVNNSQIWFIPLVNPNGHRIVTEQIDLWWRKNIRDNNLDGNFDTDNSSGYGTDGVDPNRNYGWEWGSVGTSDEFTSPVYHGPEAWSEPEIFAMKGLVESHHFVTGITYHSYSELVLFPFGYQYGAVAPDQGALEELATEMAVTIPSEYGGHYTPQQSLELYPCMGTTDDFSYGEHGIFSFTVELGTVFIPPSDEINGICEDNIEAAMILLDRVNHSTVTGHITDANTGDPLVAEIYVDGIDNTGSYRNPYISDEDFGRYYRLLQNGSYDITFSAFGYIPQTVENVIIQDDSQTILDVALELAQIVQVSGTVTDGESGLPISGVSIELIDTTIDPVYTDADGQYLISNIFEDLYTFRVYSPGYATFTESVLVTTENTTFDFELFISTAESFETGSFSPIWEFSGNEDWFIDDSQAYDGIYSARSGVISDYQNSTTTVDVELASGGEVSFYVKVSSESGYDFLNFYIDNVQQEQWAGEVDWTQVSYPVTSGGHSFKWSFVKDAYVSGGSDCGWIDYVEFPTTVNPIIEVSPTSLQFNTIPGSAIQGSFTIGNSGTGNLSYSLIASVESRDNFIYSIPDSPSASSWSGNTYSELGWTDYNITDAGEITSWEILYDWSTDSWPQEGSFWAESPAGTVVEIANSNNNGSFTVAKTEFNGEQLFGNWKLWIQDTYGDGGHRARNITMSITTNQTGWLAVNPSSGVVASGDEEGISVICDPTVEDLSVGTYSGNIRIVSNDFANSEIDIPVEFVVQDEEEVMVYYKVGIHGYPSTTEYEFVVATSDESTIQACQTQLALPEDQRTLHIDGALDYGNGGFNSPWSWHIIPNEWQLVEMSIELCDGLPQYIEEDLDYWINDVGQFCAWSGYIKEEIDLDQVAIQLPFHAGWNWFSINVENDEMSLNSVLESIGDIGILIKNQSGFASYYEGFGWYGMDEFDVKSMYMLNISADVEFNYTGLPVEFWTTTIDLSEGWNWISYLPQSGETLNNALIGIEPNASFIKNQSSFANYYNDFGWYSGSGLDNMYPGEGYMLLMNVDDQLFYLEPDCLCKVVRLTKLIENQDLGLSVNPHRFEHNMAITSELDEMNEGDVLSAFVDNECRGMVKATYFPLTDRFTFNLMVYGELGEEFDFKVYKANTNQNIDVTDQIAFEINGIIGDDIEPILFKTQVLPEEFNLSQNYPNPFNPTTVISYQLPAPSSVLLAIYNIQGQLVEELASSSQEAGYHTVVWNAENQPSGLYFVRMTAGDFVSTQKMLLLK